MASKNTKAYDHWSRMIHRATDKSYKGKNKTYESVTVCDEWLNYNAFKQWFDANYFIGYELDKDLLIENNKIYSPKTCVFVPHWVNTLFTTTYKTNGLPYGITYESNRKKYKVSMSKYGKSTLIGRYNNVIEAELAYKKAKYGWVINLADEHIIDTPSYVIKLILEVAKRKYL